VRCGGAADVDALGDTGGVLGPTLATLAMGDEISIALAGRTD
jgi:hypothetical protein